MIKIREFNGREITPEIAARKEEYERKLALRMKSVENYRP